VKMKDRESVGPSDLQATKPSPVRQTHDQRQARISGSIRLAGRAPPRLSANCTTRARIFDEACIARW
jgi:hypothetical protein